MPKTVIIIMQRDNKALCSMTQEQYEQTKLQQSYFKQLSLGWKTD